MLAAILSRPKLIAPGKWLEPAEADQIQFNSMEQIKQILVAGVPGYSMTSTGASIILPQTLMLLWHIRVLIHHLIVTLGFKVQ